MTNFCYDIIGVYYADVNKHSKQDMIDLGFHIVKCRAFLLGIVDISEETKNFLEEMETDR